ncbi:MAG: hypothetical protein ABW068_14300, partial [Candidatus Thiodiazotropha sp.]
MKNKDIAKIKQQASLRSHERFWDIQVHQNRFDLRVFKTLCQPDVTVPCGLLAAPQNVLPVVT